jgi:hypothetical protein
MIERALGIMIQWGVMAIITAGVALTYLSWRIVEIVKRTDPKTHQDLITPMPVLQGWMNPLRFDRFIYQRAAMAGSELDQTIRIYKQVRLLSQILTGVWVIALVAMFVLTVMRH